MGGEAGHPDRTPGCSVGPLGDTVTWRSSRLTREGAGGEERPSAGGARDGPGTVGTQAVGRKAQGSRQRDGPEGARARAGGSSSPPTLSAPPFVTGLFSVLGS